MSSIGWITVVNEDSPAPELLRYDIFVAGLFKVMDSSLMKMHAALGVCGEAGELGDAIKREVIYGKPTDLENIIEELGDLKFYSQAIMNMYGISEQDVLQTNANKLAARYKGLMYSDKAAIDRADKNPETGTGTGGDNG